ncbi:hypothetical protein CEXT_484091 [Caerostris extrusa]|uniref:Uncharacterized protein n=1 Tax=Caerostris extrusa TaxID=172846 RepID=A0AAV4NZQ2_CAEEX|nr:hypothetical protein CEXT_484091 [Caerostris extrusa]
MSRLTHWLEHKKAATTKICYRINSFTAEQNELQSFLGTRKRGFHCLASNRSVEDKAGERGGGEHDQHSFKPETTKSCTNIAEPIVAEATIDDIMLPDAIVQSG